MARKVKRSVPCRAELNGQVGREWSEVRMVYTRADGSEFINHMGGPHDLEAGVAIFRSRTIGSSEADIDAGQCLDITTHQLIVLASRRAASRVTISLPRKDLR